MTEQELREKIIKALKRGGNMFHEYFMRSLNGAKESGKTRFGSKDCDKSMYDFFADALIADWIGDVREAKIESDHFWRMWQGALVELEQAEHRAEVAERALKRFAENISCEDCPFFSDCSSLEKMKDSVHSNYCFAEYLRQAEKELAEEWK